LRLIAKSSMQSQWRGINLDEWVKNRQVAPRGDGTTRLRGVMRRVASLLNRLFDHPRCAVRTVYIPRNIAAEVAARAEISEATTAGNAGVGVQDDLLPGFYRFVGLNRQSIHCALERIDLFVERIDLPLELQNLVASCACASE